MRKIDLVLGLRCLPRACIFLPAFFLGLTGFCQVHHLALTRVENTPLSYVDPYIGTGGHGHVFLGASVPYGAVQAGPTNIVKGWDWCSGYHYSDSILIGFSQTHLSGTGIGDLGDVLIMPYTGAVQTHPGSQTRPDSGYASHYHHKNETARPAYYSVLLEDYGIRAEVTASERVSFYRYTFRDR